jgi:hypothetical protein
MAYISRRYGDRRPRCPLRTERWRRDRPDSLAAPKARTMKLTQKVFHELYAARSKRTGSPAFAVRSVNKDGSLSKMPPLVECATEEEAETQKSRLESLNPNRKYAITKEGTPS